VDRERADLQNTANVEKLKRDIKRIAGTLQGGGRCAKPYSTGPPASASSGGGGDHSAESAALGAGGGGEGTRNGYDQRRIDGGGGGYWDDMDAFKQELVSSLRSEIRELIADLTSSSSRRNVRTSPIATSALAPPLTSDLYQTHLYTQL